MEVAPTAEASELVLREALDWIGTPYRHQGSRKGVGCDCLGLVIGIWREVYGREPESAGAYAGDWAEAGAGERLLDAARRHCREKQLDEMAPGDLILFRWRPYLPAKHAGIFAGDWRFVHAYEGCEVTLSVLVPSWRRRVAGVFGFPGLASALCRPSR